MSVQTIETMAKWIENNVTGTPTLKEMSSYVGYSSFYCSMKFKEHMGMTYKQFLARCRLTAAEKDIRNTEDKITDIAFRYGYSSSESLTRAFATRFQCSPSHYRKAFTRQACVCAASTSRRCEKSSAESGIECQKN